MKKTVIKRRKRVPAAPGASTTPSGRMSDQAAAEALVAVGRLAAGNSGTTEEEEEIETPEPKRKRTRRGKSARDKEDEDIAMEEVESEGRPSSSQRRRSAWDGRSVSPQNRAPSRSDYLNRGPNATGPFAPTGSPHSGFEIPPLVALGNSAAAAALLNAQSSYMRSGSNAPSRTHSPLGHGAGPYGLPPGPPFYPTDINMFNLSLAMGSFVNVPTVADLERHYMDLGEHRKRTEEMLERTDRIMAAMKRGIDEMRNVMSQQQANAMAAVPLGPPAPQEQRPQEIQTEEIVQPQVPTTQPAEAAATSPVEQERPRDSVWPIMDEAARE